MEQHPLHSIAVLRTAALGDICMSIPLLLRLRDSFPDARIHWIIREDMADLVDDLPGIELIKIPKPNSLKSWRQCGNILKKYRFDALLMTQSSLRSNLLSLLIQARKKYGYGKLHRKDFQQFFITDEVVCHKEHLVDSFLRFAEAIGVPMQPPRFKLQLSGAEQGWATDQLKDQRKGPIVAVCPTSSKAERDWPLDRCSSLIKALQARGAYVVLIGGKDATSSNACRQLESTATSPLLNLSGRSTIKQLAAVLEQSSCLIAPDTGPVHIATAVGIPVIGLYAVMSPEKTGPYFSIEHCVDKYAEAMTLLLKKDPSASQPNTRAHHKQAMELISLQDVLDKCDAVLPKAIPDC